LRENVRELAKQVTGKDPFTDRQEVAAPQARSLADLSSRLVAAEVDEEILAAKLKVLEGMYAKQAVVLPEAVVEKAIADSPQVQKVWESLTEKKTRLADLESRLGPRKE